MRVWHQLSSRVVPVTVDATTGAPAPLDFTAISRPPPLIIPMPDAGSELSESPDAGSGCSKVPAAEVTTPRGFRLSGWNADVDQPEVANSTMSFEATRLADGNGTTTPMQHLRLSHSSRHAYQQPILESSVPAWIASGKLKGVDCGRLSSARCWLAC